MNETRGEGRVLPQKKPRKIRLQTSEPPCPAEPHPESAVARNINKARRIAPPLLILLRLKEVFCLLKISLDAITLLLHAGY